jgi:hypothetical protein
MTRAMMNRTAWNRRQWLAAGTLGVLGLTQADLARLRAADSASAAHDKKRRNSCVFLFLFGGPSQIDLWDMKPEAPAEVRGEFQPIDTVVPGVHICEHLPLLAREMDKLCLLRSMTHRMNVHGPACSEIFTGREYFGPPTTDEASPQDWPSLSALTMRFGAPFNGLPPSVVLPWYLQFPGQSRKIAGQTGGRMGERHNAFLVQGDMKQGTFEIPGMKIFPEVPLERLERRRALLQTFEGLRFSATGPLSQFQASSQGAFELLQNRASEVLSLEREPPALLERYGKSEIGQSLIMARRLVEAGVSLVTVNWQDETLSDGVNTCWDTHQQNFPKLKNLLCPLFDRAFSAFLADLYDRGLLETTLVVALGEFGRTPKLGQFTQSANTQSTGRDHWPHAFTALAAGGGIRGGQVYGATTPNAGFVVDKPVTPADLSATILHYLGIDPHLTYEDEFQQVRQVLSEGTVIADLG